MMIACKGYGERKKPRKRTNERRNNAMVIYAA